MLCDCGSTLQEGVKFCSQCGKKVLAPASQDVQTIPCPNTVEGGRRTPACGTMIDSSNRFCHECAWRISSKAFLPGAAMCDGRKSNGEACDNIVTPNIKFCSECGEPPKGQPSQTKTSASGIAKFFSLIDIYIKLFFINILNLEFFFFRICALHYMYFKRIFISVLYNDYLLTMHVQKLN